ncbi:MAG: L-erythro-3,5-diaminohexanoate dehydrogenase [Polyangiaceae bacterium]|nr:L-erythro-3,5-diaminohexanoate dehydrogenase [Polyangiaceae bacterium]
MIDDERPPGSDPSRYATAARQSDDMMPGDATARPVEPVGDPYGTHRSIEPPSALPQPAWRVDNDFTRLFRGETLVAVETLNLDAASFVQIEHEAREAVAATSAGGAVDDAVENAMAHIVLRTVADRGKQHNPVTGSGGVLLGRVVQVVPPAAGSASPRARRGDRVATLASLSLTPLRIDAVVAVHRARGQMDVAGEAVIFESAPFAVLPPDLPERLSLAVLDVAGAAPQVARMVRPGAVVVVLGAGGKSGVLCAVSARRAGGPTACVVGVEARTQAADELRSLGVCDAVVIADARDPVAVRREVLAATGGREADLALSCVTVPDAEMAAILVTRDGGTAYFFAMSTSFTRAALGAEGIGKDVQLVMGNGYAHGHAEHTLGLIRAVPALRALFERRY